MLRERSTHGGACAHVCCGSVIEITACRHSSDWRANEMKAGSRLCGTTLSVAGGVAVLLSKQGTASAAGQCSKATSAP